MKLSETNKIKLLKIEKARLLLSKNIELGVITEKDLINLVNFKSNYGLNRKHLKYKEKILLDVFNSPFILCDIDTLSFEVKTVLPMLLMKRYNSEIEELKYMSEQEYITHDEYIKEKQLLKYFYFESTNDGREMLEKGYDSLHFSKTKSKKH